VDYGVLASGLCLAALSIGVVAGLNQSLGLLLVVAVAATSLVAGGSFLIVYWRQRGSRAGRRRR
jgi:hypothetical protein